MPQNRKEDNHNDNYMEDLAISLVRGSFLLLALIVGVVINVIRMNGEHRAKQKENDLLAPKTTAASDGSIPANTSSPDHKPTRLVRQIETRNASIWIATGGIIGLIVVNNFVSPSASGDQVLFWAVNAFFGLVFVYGLVGIFMRKPQPAVGLQRVAQPQSERVRGANVPTMKSTTEQTISPLPLPQTFVVTLPKQTAWDANRALQFMERMLATYNALVFRIYATHQEIQWHIVHRIDVKASDFEASIRVTYPDATIREITELDCLTSVYPFFRYTARYQLANDFIAPLAYVTEVKPPDPLAALTQAMNELQAGESIAYTLAVLGILPDANNEGLRMITQSTINPLQLLTAQGMADAAIKKVYHTDRVARYVPELQRMFEDKVTRPLYQANLCIQIDTPTEERLDHLLNVQGALVNFARLPYNGLGWIQDGVDNQVVEVKDENANYETTFWGILVTLSLPQNKAQRQLMRLVLDTRELALLWHLPHKDCTASRIVWMSGRNAPIPNELSGKNDGVKLGEAAQAGKREPVYLRREDRSSHVNIIGKTGFGKTTLLHHLITQDIAAGYGVAVIDPHGALVRDVLRYSIPSSREEDVVVLDLSDTETPPPLNPLRGGTGHARIGHLVSIIERLFPDTAQYARLSRYLRAALITLQADPEATLLDIDRLFQDDSFRARLLKGVQDESVLLTWERYDKQKRNEQDQIYDPISHRFSPFYGNEYLAPIICHPQALDLRDLMRQRRILLLSLKMSSEFVPEAERDILGALVFSRLQLGDEHTGSVPSNYIYIDEVQRFIKSPLDEMFAGIRKFGISLTVAHQSLTQLDQNTLQGILSNVGASIVFGCGPADARTFASFVHPQFDAEDLIHLDKYQAVVKMQLDGKSVDAFTLFASPPPSPIANVEAREQYMRDLSRKNYTPMRREEVIEALRKRRKSSADADDQTQHLE